jgi:hypothetical protein
MVLWTILSLATFVAGCWMTYDCLTRFGISSGLFFGAHSFVLAFFGAWVAHDFWSEVYDP